MNKPKRILLVEDDYLDVISVKRALGKLNVEYTLHVAHNGAEALSMLMGSSAEDINLHPDIILLDINMPKMNGIEFLEIIKKYYSLSNIKVFIMTTSSEQYDKAAAEKLGISGYILKPLDFETTERDESAKAVFLLKEEVARA
jgi:CheY-like chemotaxis protein